jgi:hypothetical protein
MNPWLKEQVKTAMLRREILCERRNTYCRFAIPGYCLVEFKECEYFQPKERQGERGDKASEASDETCEVESSQSTKRT